MQVYLTESNVSKNLQSTWTGRKHTKISAHYLSTIITKLLRLINGLPALEKQMTDQKVANFKTFNSWLVEEKEYLQGLSREPLEETLQMEYYQKLVNLADSQKKLDEAQVQWLVITPENMGHRYQCCLDKLESLVVAQMFELCLKLKPGYKLRKQIGNALKAHLQAV
ncbi:hypothetical protein C0992_003483 [Termitomyces sp. T32_za158]|nr:hypothetical protein C0992_003483 [Termitomyces sp. T32_za158]